MATMSTISHLAVKQGVKEQCGRRQFDNFAGTGSLPYMPEEAAGFAAAIGTIVAFLIIAIRTAVRTGKRLYVRYLRGNGQRICDLVTMFALILVVLYVIATLFS